MATHDAAAERGLAQPPPGAAGWGYYVYDGHRVAAARALGQEFIAARIT